MANVKIAQTVHYIVRTYSVVVGMVIDSKKSAQLSVTTPLPESLQAIPMLDETTYKYLGFGMKGEVDTEEIMRKQEKRKRERMRSPQDELKPLRQETGPSL